MIKNTANNKNLFKFLIMALIFIFTSGIMAVSDEAGAAAIGKKKKGYSSKKARTVKTAAVKSVKKAAASLNGTKTAAKKAVKTSEAALKEAEAEVLAEANEAVEETEKSTAKLYAKVPVETQKMAAAVKTSVKPVKAMALSANNYYESRYSELAVKSSNKKSEAEQIFIMDKKTAMKNTTLASRMVISSDGNESYFGAEAAKTAAAAKKSVKKTAGSARSAASSKAKYYEPVEETYLAKNSAAKTKTFKDARDEDKAKNEAAQEENTGFFSKYLGNSESRLKWFPGLYLNLGANVLQNPDNGTRKMWSKLGAIPRFSYNNISFAYDLTFYFDENNNMRKTDWDTFDDYIRKIYYIYYGKPGDRLSARVEMIDDLTLGSGAIFRNYCGSLRYPLIDKKVGGVVTYETGFDDYIKLFVDDVASPGIYAASFEIVPHDHVQIGAQVVSDNKVNTGFRNENVSVGSVHVGIPLSSKYNSKFKIYEEIGKIRNFGMGMHTGVVAETPDFIFKTEFRSMSSDYIPNYFDTLYEMERHYKGRALARLRDNGERVTGWFNEFKAKIEEAYTFRLSYEKDYSNSLKPHLSVGVDYTGMDYNKLKLSANYDRKNLYYSNSRVSDAIYGLKARYDISDSSSMCYELRHVLNESGKPVDSINIETQLKF
jgi:hypothetical protein